MRICIIGAGLLGQVYAAILASVYGNSVFCIDNDTVVSQLNSGRSTAQEPELQQLIADAYSKGLLTAQTTYDSAPVDCEAIILCLPTPNDDTGIPLYNCLEEALRQLGPFLAQVRSYPLVVVRSTVLPGTTAKLIKPLLEKAGDVEHGIDFGLVVVPEFLRSGTAIRDALKPAREVWGINDDRDIVLLERLFPESAPLRIITGWAEAELCKVAANAFLALHVSFANELAVLGALLGGLDVNAVLRGITADDRHNLYHGQQLSRPTILDYMQPSLGYGGPCLPKDTAALAGLEHKMGMHETLTQATCAINCQIVERLITSLEHQCGSLAGLNITVLSLAYKPDFNSVTNSPAITLCRLLVEKHANVRVVDKGLQPTLLSELPEWFKRIEFAHEVSAGLDGADICILTVAQRSLLHPPNDYANWLRPEALFVDMTGIFQETDFHNLGLRFQSYLGVLPTTNLHNQDDTSAALENKHGYFKQNFECAVDRLDSIYSLYELSDYRLAKLLCSFAELNLLKRLTKPVSASKAACECQLDPTTTEIALEAMCECGVVRRNGAYYVLNGDNLHNDLDDLFWGSAFNLRSLYWPAWDKLNNVLRDGRPDLSGSVIADWSTVEWATYYAAQIALAKDISDEVVRLLELDTASLLLDVGGGAGVYSRAACRYAPHLLATLVDLPIVDYIAQKYLNASPESPRMRFEAADIFSFAPAELYDRVLVSNVLHVLDNDQCLKLLRRCRSWLAPGGILVIKDFFYQKEEKSRNALFNLHLHVCLSRGQAPTFENVLACLQELGPTASVERMLLSDGASTLLKARFAE